MKTELNINGETRTVEAAPGTPLLWVLRDLLGLTGTKFGCGIAACGACTVHLDGMAVRSCQTMVEDAAGSKITTIEGISASDDPVARAVQDAWREAEVVQCGYCQSGQIMAAIGLLRDTPKPSDEDINLTMDGNACRCATYIRIKQAIHLAAEKLEG